MFEGSSCALCLQVLETNRIEETQSHVHRMYFMGPNTFTEPWHLVHSPPEQVLEIVYGSFPLLLHSFSERIEEKPQV